MTLFVDLDGVLADFDTGHELVFGYRPRRDHPDLDVDWDKLFAYPEFFRWLPVMKDAGDLWTYVRQYNPTILTGIPKSYPQAADDKRAWVRQHFGDVPIICCQSKDKVRHGRPGDILVDDWDKYRQLWTDAGGIWIQHYSAAQSIRALQELFGHEHLSSLRREV